MQRVMSMRVEMEKQKKKAGMSSTYIYNPSSGRHLKPESKPPPNAAMAVDKSKTTVLRNWFNFSIRKPKPRPEFDVQDEQRQQQGRRGRGGGEVVVEAAARKSVSHVETNLVSVAEFLQVKVLVSDMPGFMQVHAFRSARRTYDSLEKFSSKHMAYNLKKEFDKMYGPAWHCIVGSGFGSFVTHSTGCFLYFSMEKLCILLFRTKIQKAQD